MPCGQAPGSPPTWSTAVPERDNPTRQPKLAGGRVSKRRTRESDIVIELDLDGRAGGPPRRSVLRPQLTALSSHASFDLTVRATGDVEIEAHHTIEDTAIALSTALGQALGDARASATWRCLHPMDETLAHRRRRLIPSPYCVHTESRITAAHHYCRQFVRPTTPSSTGHVPELAANARIAPNASACVVRARPANYGRSSIQASRRALRQAVEPDPRVLSAVHQRCSVTAKSVVVPRLRFQENLRSAQRAANERRRGRSNRRYRRRNDR